jgi:hypothetical protein
MANTYPSATNMAEKQYASLHRAISGINATFGPGAGLQSAVWPGKTRLTDRISVKAHANSVWIEWKWSPDYREEHLRLDLGFRVGRLRSLSRLNTGGFPTRQDRVSNVSARRFCIVQCT